jgi:hypothetical protein
MNIAARREEIGRARFDEAEGQADVLGSGVGVEAK